MELWDLYDENRIPLGRTLPRGEPLPQGAYHLSVGIWIVDGRGNILLTLRSPEKEDYPNCWENPGGAVLAGEKSPQAAQRELREETGIAVALEDLHYLGESRRGRRIMDSYVLQGDFPLESLHLQPGETTAAQWVTIQELMHMAQDGRLATPIAKTMADLGDALAAWY